MSERRLLDRPQAAEYLGMSEGWIRKAEAAGKIRALRLGTAVRYDRADLDTYVESLKATVGETAGTTRCSGKSQAATVSKKVQWIAGDSRR